MIGRFEAPASYLTGRNPATSRNHEINFGDRVMTKNQQKRISRNNITLFEKGGRSHVCIGAGMRGGAKSQSFDVDKSTVGGWICEALDTLPRPATMRQKANHVFAALSVASKS